MSVSLAAETDPLFAYMDECRALVLAEIRHILPPDGPDSGGLYELMLDYPLRGGKALRPALCVATCRALGGSLAGVLSSAAVLELYHNAFLIHDDVEDGSLLRRNEDTLHRTHGVPIAVNVGDGMLALSMGPLLDNVELLGLGRALRILQTVARMARESAEGQMMELDWIRRADWRPSNRSYVRMVYKKSAWYSFITPMLVGAIAAGADRTLLWRLAHYATLLGVAFQIQDDVLNLVAAEDRYGKEIDGDLWEGKHTLILIHALRHATPEERTRAVGILGRARPGAGAARGPERAAGLVEELESAGEITADAARRLRAALSDATATGPAKSEADVRFLRSLVERRGSLGYARRRARQRAQRAARRLRVLSREIPPSVHRDFLERLTDFVVHRDC